MDIPGGTALIIRKVHSAMKLKSGSLPLVFLQALVTNPDISPLGGKTIDK
jgi:hypothetical protein